MARSARVKSSIGIYHIMLRGIDRREIFIDNEDREMFCRCILRAKEKGSFVLHGYCLMDNHVHLLMEEGNEHIGNSMKRITVGYVQWHNLKYSRTGHLFQNRYKSEPVENEGYFLTVLRYIHQNPVKAGMVKDMAHYKWSSYHSYLESFGQGKAGFTRSGATRLRSTELGSKGPGSVRPRSVGLINTDLVKGLLPSQAEFVDFMNTLSDDTGTDQPLEYEEKANYSDENLKNRIIRIYAKPELIMSLPTEERDKIIKEIKQSIGPSNRQLSRVLGIGRRIIERI